MNVAATSETTTVSGIHVDPENTITPGQLELLALYASGYSYAEIGQFKFKSAYTVRNTLLLALKRSEARSLTHLCLAILEVGMIRKNPQGVYEPVADLRVVS